ncbi:uncharacterized protein HMPREF1541_00566 [Cyphellophora europaea CBS 101466]|uniref:PCI domain-containing protein n=1 Tax=Cyphellophora europaea (strain CBS 101466) TaxID=1220924 RepID=W2SCH6_CYPE1|nr:uncharacterized protein HMPREF1541_00566 [Cyphellophora europaea CBS 101466]ETN46382.1 hypothetical protein HMPREF1541_00566 [Cyphellophora europaea CBS 101466]
MEPAHVKALGALQPFILLATTTKSPSPRFLADLIKRATEAPGTYVFTELLQQPAIQSLRADETPSEFQTYLTLLEIFSWGTYEEYQATPNIPTLSDAQTQKLKQLSLLTLASPFASLASANANTLAYSSLVHSLHLPSSAALESLVTSCIYAGLLSARLSPTSNPPAVHIHSVAPLRDIRPQSLPAILQILSTWSARCDTVASELDAHITSIKTTARDRSIVAQKRQDVVDAAVLSNANDDADKRSGRSGRGQRGSKRDLDDEYGGSDGEGMDVDEGIGEMGASFGGAGGSRGTKRNRGRG